MQTFKLHILIFVLNFPLQLFSQKQANIWVFGDSACVDFNGTLATPCLSALNSRGSCASICNTNGNLILYAGSSPDPTLGGSLRSVKVRNNLDLIILNGDSLIGLGWYNENIITPHLSNSNDFYIFSIGVTTDYGIYYSIVDMSQNGGLGAVTQKNIQLQSFKCTDGLSAVKHGNGRDWWVVFKNWTNSNNNIYQYLITPNGISNVIVQSVGNTTSNNTTHFQFSPNGNKLAMINYPGLLEIYDFDRCSGVISNPITIHTEPGPGMQMKKFWGCEFSLSGRFLYVTSMEDTSFVYQYDLTAGNIASSRITLDSIFNFRIGNGELKRGPDNKIYLSSAWECSAIPWCYPYPDTVYNYVNMNLGVINYPDSLGTACGYAPFSFYLGGKRTYYGLPNNPDYDMPALAGSVCDTLTGLTNPLTPNGGTATLQTTYISGWQKLFVNAQHIKGSNFVLRIYDLQGREVYSQTGKTIPPYFTTTVNCNAFSNGLYIFSLATDRESLSAKFFKE